MPSGVRFVFTLNNYVESDIERLAQLSPEVKYLTYGKEVGENGTPHLQGFVWFSNPKSFGAVKKLLGNRVHVEGSRTIHAAIRYCHKDGDIVEYGEKPQANAHERKYDLAKLVESYKSGGAKRARDEDEIGWLHYGAKIRRNIYVKPPYRGDIDACWIYGPTGTGKSRWAYEKYPDAYRKAPQTKWWDGYDGELEVVIDDICPNGMSIANCLRWIDRYPCLVETKGGSEALLATKFVFTSNLRPRDVWPDVEREHLDAFFRRVRLLKINEI